MTEITRGEFDMLAQQVRDNAVRINAIDDHGSRGVSTVQVQVTEIIKDIGDLKSDINGRFTAHELLHQREKDERRSAKRWFVSTCIGFATALAALLAGMTDLLVHIH